MRAQPRWDMAEDRLFQRLPCQIHTTGQLSGLRLIDSRHPDTMEAAASKSALSPRHRTESWSFQPVSWVKKVLEGLLLERAEPTLEPRIF